MVRCTGNPARNDADIKTAPKASRRALPTLGTCTGSRLPNTAPPQTTRDADSREPRVPRVLRRRAATHWWPVFASVHAGTWVQQHFEPNGKSETSRISTSSLQSAQIMTQPLHSEQPAEADLARAEKVIQYYHSMP